MFYPTIELLKPFSYSVYTKEGSLSTITKKPKVEALNVKTLSHRPYSVSIAANIYRSTVAIIKQNKNSTQTLEALQPLKTY